MPLAFHGYRLYLIRIIQILSRIFNKSWFCLSALIAHALGGNGLDKSGGTMDALDDAEYSGSVLSLIENGEAFIKRNARMMWRKTLNLREKLPEYVERSCHEAQINYRQRNRLSGSFVIDAHRERYRKTPTPPTGFSCPLGVFTQVVLGVVFRQSTTASKPLKRRPAIIGRACAGLNCRVNARKSPTL